MERHRKKMNKIVIAVIIIAVSFGFAGGLMTNYILMPEETDILQIPDLKTYKYNTLCDIEDMEKFFIEEVWTTTMAVTNGHHNDDPKVIEFYKTNEFLAGLQLTPETFLPAAHPALTDVMFWMPLTLDMLNVSPQIKEILVIEEGQSQAEYEVRLTSEIAKCEGS